MFDADPTLGVNRWPIVRLHATSRSETVLLSSRFFALTTHWIGYTTPCCGDGCALCEIIPARGLFYVAVHCEGRRRLVELGAVSASNFEQHAKLLHGGMRPGLTVLWRRQGAKSPVRSEVIGWKEGVSEVPQLELATRVLCVFKYPPPNVGEDLTKYELRCRAAARVRCSRAAETLLKKQASSMA